MHEVRQEEEEEEGVARLSGASVIVISAEGESNDTPPDEHINRPWVQ